LFVKVATDREVVAKNADAADGCSASLCESLRRINASRNLGKQIKFDSRLDRGGLLVCHDSIHEQIG
jgi:hypothetical protein